MESTGYVNDKYHWKRWAAMAAFLFILLISLLIFFKILPGMNSNDSVNGMVFDAASGQPVSNALIMITGGTHEHPDIASQSDDEGNFSLPSLAIPGTYTLLIRHNDISKEITININQKDTLLKIPL